MSQKIKDICKDIILIVCIFICLRNTASAISYRIPENPKTRIPISASFSATKILESGEVAGTMPVVIEGSYNTYSSGDKKLEMKLFSLDGFTDFTYTRSNGAVSTLPSRNSQMVMYYADKDGRTYNVIFYFSEKFDYWMIIINGWESFVAEENRSGKSTRYAFYAGSTNESASLEDICKYFSMEYLLTIPENSTE